MSETHENPGPASAPVALPPLGSDPVEIARALVDARSVSGEETALADAVETALRACPHLEVLRHGDTVVARTHLSRPERVIVAGHLDTVPVAVTETEPTGNVPGRLETRDGQEVLWGRGSVDMKGGDAVILHLAAALTAPRRDVTWVLYDHEEVEASLNGLGRALDAHPDWFEADLAVLGEPTAGNIEGGCNGTLRLILDVPGRAAHSGRAWVGANAIHAAGVLIGRAAAAPVRTVDVEGLAYREGFNVTLVEGGVATNTIPPSCRVTVNYRFAPDLSAQEALARAKRVLAGLPVDGAEQGGETDLVVDGGTGPVAVTLDDLSPAARPGLDSPLAAELIAAVRERGGEVGPKYGWTDVARFSAAGIPAVNLGPGDALLAHTDDEHCPVDQIRDVAGVLHDWLA